MVSNYAFMILENCNHMIEDKQVIKLSIRNRKISLFDVTAIRYKSPVRWDITFITCIQNNSFLILKTQ